MCVRSTACIRKPVAAYWTYGKDRRRLQAVEIACNGGSQQVAHELFSLGRRNASAKGGKQPDLMPVDDYGRRFFRHRRPAPPLSASSPQGCTGKPTCLHRARHQLLYADEHDHTAKKNVFPRFAVGICRRNYVVRSARSGRNRGRFDYLGGCAAGAGLRRFCQLVG